MLPVSLDCSCFITLSVFYNIYLSCVLSTLCYQFLWIVHVLLPCHYLSCVLSTLCYQFLWIVHVLLPCQYSITFICPVSCVLYVTSFSGLFMFYCPVYIYLSVLLPVSLDCSCFIALSVFYNIYLSCVLSTLCYQFLWIVHVLLPFRYSITFICPVSCLLYVTSFSGLFMFYCYALSFFR